jgi:hypothetical protein
MYTKEKFETRILRMAKLKGLVGLVAQAES